MGWPPLAQQFPHFVTLLSPLVAGNCSCVQVRACALHGDGSVRSAGSGIHVERVSLWMESSQSRDYPDPLRPRGCRLGQAFPVISVDAERTEQGCFFWLSRGPGTGLSLSLGRPRRAGFVTCTCCVSSLKAASVFPVRKSCLVISGRLRTKAEKPSAQVNVSTRRKTPVLESWEKGDHIMKHL